MREDLNKTYTLAKKVQSLKKIVGYTIRSFKFSMTNEVMKVFVSMFFPFNNPNY